MTPRRIGDGVGYGDNGVGMGIALSSPSASTPSLLVSGNLRTNKDNNENVITCDCKPYLLPVTLINHRTQQCFFVIVFIVHLHYMFRSLIVGHLQAICDKIYSKVATVYVNGSVELTCLRQVPWLCKSIQYTQYKNI
jgi:hypothetical protein